MASSYRNLEVWQRSRDLAIRVYRLTAGLPRHEMYGITSQMRRAAVSVPANIAEGQARMGQVEFVRFLRIALGSVAELETHLDIAHGLQYLPSDEYNQLARESEEITRMLHGLIAGIRRRQQQT